MAASAVQGDMTKEDESGVVNLVLFPTQTNGHSHSTKKTLTQFKLLGWKGQGKL
jgi:hypothetical protein